MAGLPGYAGSIMHVDCATAAARREETPRSLAEDYVGGRGFIARTLYDQLPAGADPLSPAARLVVASGPLSGHLVPAAAKVIVGAKSPATGGYGEGNAGGHFCAELKQAGLDMLVFAQAFAAPTLCVIDDDQVSFRDAGKYWGLGSAAAEKALKQDLGEEYQILTIGPAGENGVAVACISHDFGRQVGRCGLGAVMGSKKLKGIAVRGSHPIAVARHDEMMAIGSELFGVCFGSPALELWQSYGTSSVTNWANRIGGFPTRNFQSGQFSEFAKLTGIEMRDRIVVNDKGCYACPIACGKYSKTKVRDHERDLEVLVEGPEYETTALIGGNCALSSIEDVAYANYLCDEYGIDTISGGSIVGFAMECFERGILTTKDTDGLELRFGNAQAAFDLIRMIASKQGIGAVLAGGTRAAARAFGQGSEKFAMQVKGLEISGYESRNLPAMALSYMTSDIGAHHRASWAVSHDLAVGREVTRGKAPRVIELQHTRTMFDTLGVCRLPWIELGVPFAGYARAYRAITGIEHSAERLLEISERIWNLTRAFNLRETPGYGRAYDLPPARWWEEPVADGPTQGKKLARDDIEAMLDEYYELRGWSGQGIPTLARMQRLGLGREAAEIGAR